MIGTEAHAQLEQMANTFPCARCKPCDHTVCRFAMAFATVTSEEEDIGHIVVALATQLGAFADFDEQRAFIKEMYAIIDSGKRLKLKVMFEGRSP